MNQDKQATIASTIISQLGGQGRLGAMVSAHNYVSLNQDENRSGGLSFKFKGSTKANCCVVTLLLDDTYQVTFHKVGKIGLKQVHEVSGVYCDQLVPLFESVTGLYLSI